MNMIALEIELALERAGIRAADGPHRAVAGLDHRLDERGRPQQAPGIRHRAAAGLKLAPRAVRRAAGGLPAMRLGEYRSCCPNSARPPARRCGAARAAANPSIISSVIEAVIHDRHCERSEAIHRAAHVKRSDCFVASLLAMLRVSQAMTEPDVPRTALSPSRRQRSAPRSRRRGVDDLCDSEGAGRRLRLHARPIPHAAHHHGRRGSAPLLFDLLRPRRRRAAHRREEGRRRRVLELGRGRIEVRRRTRRDDADRPLRHRARARRGADLCRLCRRQRHHADPVDRQGRAGARAGQPLLSVLRQPLDNEHAVPRRAGGIEGSLHAAALAVPRHLGRGAGHSDPARPARRRQGARAAALAGAGRERRSRLHLRSHRA